MISCVLPLRQGSLKVFVIGINGHQPEPVLDTLLQPHDLEPPGASVDVLVQSAPGRALAVMELTKLHFKELEKKEIYILLHCHCTLLIS